MKKGYWRILSLLLCALVTAGGIWTPGALALELRPVTEPLPLPEEEASDWEKGGDHVASGFDSILKGLGEMAGFARDRVTGAWQDAAEAVSDFGASVGDSVRSGVSGALNWVSGMADSTGSWLANTWQSGVDGVAAIGQGVGERADSIVSGLRNALASMAGDIFRQQELTAESEEILSKLEAWVSTAVFTPMMAESPWRIDSETAFALGQLDGYVRGMASLNDYRLASHILTLKSKALELGLYPDEESLETEREGLRYAYGARVYLNAFRYLFLSFRDEGYANYIVYCGYDPILSPEDIEALIAQLEAALGNYRLFEEIAAMNQTQKVTWASVGELLPVDTESLNAFFDSLSTADQARLLAWVNDSFGCFAGY